MPRIVSKSKRQENIRLLGSGHCGLFLFDGLIDGGKE